MPFDTLQKRLKGIQPRKKAHEKEMLLNEAKQSVLVDWMRFLSLAGLPIYKCTLQPKIKVIMQAKGMELAEESVSDTWIQMFLKKHRDLIKSTCSDTLIFQLKLKLHRIDNPRFCIILNMAIPMIHLFFE